MEPSRDWPPDTLRRLEAYTAAVEQSPHNLMSPRGLAELRSRHLPECLALARFLPSERGRLLDVGTGAGLPGLVIAVVRPDLDVWLLDATRKKTDFLRSTATALGLDNVTTVHTRAEQARATMGGSFDTVTARAVAPLLRLVDWTVPFLAAEGRVLAVKGARWREELRDAASALERAGAVVVRTPADPLPPGVPAAEWTPRVVTLARRCSPGEVVASGM